jgi:hypothetical protein
METSAEIVRDGTGDYWLYLFSAKTGNKLAINLNGVSKSFSPKQAGVILDVAEEYETYNLDRKKKALEQEASNNNANKCTS